MLHAPRPLLGASVRFISREQVEASERVHGEIDPSQVRSKVMRRKLEKAKAAGTALTTTPEPADHDDSALTPSGLSRSHLQEIQQHQQPQQPVVYRAEEPQQFEQPSFGQVMWANFKMGIAISLGFMVVAVLFRAIGMEGAEGEPSAIDDVAFEDADAQTAAAPAATVRSATCAAGALPPRMQ